VASKNAAARPRQDSLFMNAQNWQTIPRIAIPLRRLGVPAAAIFDFDVLMDDQFAHIWPLLSTDQPKLQELQHRKATVKKLMGTKGRTSCKESGVGAFSEPDKLIIQSFITEMAKFGVFFVPVGELERWLANLGIAANPKDKARWLTEMFTRMGADPALPGYVSADWDDVWEFIGHVRDWISDPNRLGIPT
jgi:hypothetical protein